MKEVSTYEKRENKGKCSGSKWILETVVMAVLPMVLSQLFYRYTNNIQTSWSIRDFVLLVASVAYGLFFFVLSKMNVIKKSFISFVLVGSIFICMVGFAFYFYCAGRENEKYFIVVLVLCIIALLFCIFAGYKVGKDSDKAEEVNRHATQKKCQELFDVTANDEQKKILNQISKEKLYCEIQDIDLVELLKRAKYKRNEKLKNE